MAVESKLFGFHLVRKPILGEAVGILGEPPAIEGGGRSWHEEWAADHKMRRVLIRSPTGAEAEEDRDANRAKEKAGPVHGSEFQQSIVRAAGRSGPARRKASVDRMA